MENISFDSNIPKSLYCKVCNQLMLNPVVLRCGHTFCKDCIEKCEKASRPCPECRGVVMYKCNFLLKDVVHSHMGKCLLCEEKSTLGQLLTHSCPEEVVKCANENCTIHLKRKELSSHSTCCEFKKSQCQDCGTIMTNASLDFHRKQFCAKSAVACPLCKNTFKRDYMTFHVPMCQNAVAACKVQGCHFWGDQKTLQEHDSKTAMHHVKLLTLHQMSLTNAILDRKPTLTIKDVAVQSYLWTIQEFKLAVTSVALDNPMTSQDFSCFDSKWRLLLFPGAAWQINLQLLSTLSSVRVIPRFVLYGKDENKDRVYSLEPVLLKEGDMVGTSMVSLRMLEGIAEEAKSIRIKVFISLLTYGF